MKKSEAHKWLHLLAVSPKNEIRRQAYERLYLLIDNLLPDD